MTELSRWLHPPAIRVVQAFRVTSIEVSEDRGAPPPIWMPLLLLAVVSIIARACHLDHVWQRVFWSPEDGWRWANHALVRFLYHYGTWPAIFVASAGAVAWLGSAVTGKFQQLRQPGLFLVLLLALGPGLVVNAIFKDHFGRPRPTQVAEFGGHKSFRPLGESGVADEGKSFPSGHASMGFYWLGLVTYCWNRRRGLAWAFGVLGLLHGLMMGLGRMAQGGHWFTDVVWSAGFVYLSGWLLHYVWFSQRRAFEEERALEPNHAH